MPPEEEPGRIPGKSVAPTGTRRSTTEIRQRQDRRGVCRCREAGREGRRLHSYSLHLFVGALSGVRRDV